MKRYTIVLTGVKDELISHVYSICTGIYIATSRLDFGFRAPDDFHSRNIHFSCRYPNIVSALRAELSNHGIEIIDL